MISKWKNDCEKEKKQTRWTLVEHEEHLFRTQTGTHILFAAGGKIAHDAALLLFTSEQEQTLYIYLIVERANSYTTKST